MTRPFQRLRALSPAPAPVNSPGDRRFEPGSPSWPHGWPRAFSAAQPPFSYFPPGAGVSTTLFTFPLKYPPRNQFFHKVPPSQEEASPGSHCGPRTVPALGAPGGLPSLSL